MIFGKGRKPSRSFDEWSAVVAKVLDAKAGGARVADACAAAGVGRREYEYARQMVRRGRPMAEIEARAGG